MTATPPAPSPDSGRPRPRVLFVTARAYQAFEGGDGVHLDALTRHLARTCDVSGVTTSLGRGRLRPLVKLIYGGWNDWRWTYRGAVGLGRWRMILAPSAIAAFLKEGLAVLRARGFDSAWRWTEEPGEIAWLQRRIDSARPDVVVLAFEAVAMSARLRTPGRTLAMIGFLPNRAYGLGEGQFQINNAALDEALVGGLEAGDAVALNNISDQAWWNARPDKAVPALLAGMNPAPFMPLPDSEAAVALFVGNKTGPNREGLTWLLEKVWPLVLRLAPSARLRIAGRVADTLGSTPAGVDLVGRVDAIDAEYARARVVLVPLLTGSAGVKTKLAEGVAYGRAFVATSVAIEPERLAMLETCGRVTDDPDDFAQSVARLILDTTERRQRQAATRGVYDAMFSETAAYGEVDHWIQTGSNPGPSG